MVYPVKQNPRVESRSGVRYPQHCETGDAELKIAVCNNSVGPSTLRICHSDDSEYFVRVERRWPLMPCSRCILRLGTPTCFLETYSLVSGTEISGIVRAHSWEIWKTVCNDDAVLQCGRHWVGTDSIVDNS
jgi:hypothetical protein